jgi:hypothetical protein
MLFARCTLGECVSAAIFGSREQSSFSSAGTPLVFNYKCIVAISLVAHRARDLRSMGNCLRVPLYARHLESGAGALESHSPISLLFGLSFSPAAVSRTKKVNGWNCGLPETQKE